MRRLGINSFEGNGTSWNGREKIAIEQGHADSEGTPLVTVVADGSWAKLSYRTNYSSLSGVAATHIVGLNTKKVLFLGVRNKYVQKQMEKIPVEDYKCFRNWTGTSTGMEADIIFTTSMKMHGIMYNKMVADGNSNVYKRILDCRPYDNLTVEKIECKNHLIRNACNKLKEITKSAKNGNINLRKVVEDRILRMRASVTKAICFRK